MPPGFSLIEMITVVAIFAMTIASLAPSARRYRDTSTVVAARESVAGLIAEARVLAVGTGDVTVRLEADPWRAWLTMGDSVVRRLPIEADLAVRIELSGGRASTELAYDALGLGRVASETLSFVRGDARRALVVSGYGRVRRR